MRVVILMGGLGSRFAAVGYTKPKPLLEVDGKPMIEHVLAMYPSASEYIVVCGESFRSSNTVTSLQKNFADNIRTVFIPHHALGPVHSLSAVWGDVPAEEPVLVSYCDFTVGWGFNDFARVVQTEGVDGVVPGYSGFHPHLLHKKKYAGIIADENRKILDIREKHSFTENPQDSFHSAGNYYFSRAGDMRRYGETLLSSGETLNGEYYVSMIYYQYLADGRNILVYPLKHFLQWGTPEDLEEYEAWSRLLRGEHKGRTDIPESRASNVRIPHEAGSPEYTNSFNYWNEYFSH